MSILDRAELLLQAKNYSGSGNWLDESGNSHDAVPTNSPTFLAYDGTQYLWLPGSAGNSMSVPDNVFFRPTGDLEWQFQLSLDDWTPSVIPTLAVHAADTSTANTNWSIYVLTSGEIVLSRPVAGVTRSFTSAATGLANGTVKWVKITYDQDNGSSQSEVNFYLSDDGVSWDQLGSAVTSANVGNANSVSASVNLAVGPSGANFMDGDFYRFILKNGIDGTVLLDVNLNGDSVVEPFATFTEESSNAATVTVNRAASGYVSTVVDRDMWVLNGSDTYFLISDDPDLDFTDTQDLTIIAVYRSNTITDPVTAVVSKEAVAAGYLLYLANAQPTLQIRDGAVTPSDSGPSVTIRQLVPQGSRRNGTTKRIETFTNGLTNTDSPDTTTATQANAIDLNLGRRGGASSYWWGELCAVALFREALTDAEIGLVSTQLSNPEAEDPSELHEDALWWWVQQYEGRWDGANIELVGALNQLNGTTDKEYAEARGTYLGVAPAG